MCLDKSVGSPSVVTSLASACNVKSCVELLCSYGINILVVVSDIPAVWLDYKLPSTKNIVLATISSNQQ